MCFRKLFCVTVSLRVCVSVLHPNPFSFLLLSREHFNQVPTDPRVGGNPASCWGDFDLGGPLVSVPHLHADDPARTGGGRRKDIRDAGGRVSRSDTSHTALPRKPQMGRKQHLASFQEANTSQTTNGG